MRQEKTSLKINLSYATNSNQSTTMKTTTTDQKKLSVLSIFAAAVKFAMGIFSWIITIIFMIVVMIMTNTRQKAV